MVPTEDHSFLHGLLTPLRVGECCIIVAVPNIYPSIRSYFTILIVVLDPFAISYKRERLRRD